MDELSAKLILLRAPITGTQWTEIFKRFENATEFVGAGIGAWNDVGLTERSLEILSTCH